MASSCTAAVTAGVGRRQPAVQESKLYETQSMFYLIGRDKGRTTWRVLKIDRTEPTKLSIVEDPTHYTEPACQDLLRRIHTGNRATGGLRFVTKCYGIAGFVKFLGPYYMLLITRRKKIGTICGHVVYAVDKSEIITIPSPNVLPNVAHSKDENRYKRLLCSVNLSKGFFFSYSYNIMHSLQKNIIDKNTWESQYEATFVWNEFLTQGIREHLQNPIWTVALVHGFFRQEKLSVSGKDFWLTVIARRSRHFAGPRFLKRGVNEKGMVANDVETEQIVFEDTQDEMPPNITSVVQNRGSIPLFWSQETSKLPIKPDIMLEPDKDYKAARLHFENLMTRYGNPIIILNLIKVIEKKPRESLLRVEYEKAIDHINKRLSYKNRILFFHLDMKKFSRSYEVLPYLVKVGAGAYARTGILHCQLNPSSKPGDTASSEQSDITSSSNSATFMDPNFGSTKVVPLSLQKGVLRTNCIDCSDRTNGAQFAYGLVAFGHQLHALGLIEVPEIGIDDPLSRSLMDFYEAMGDVLAIQYTGSAAQNKEFWKQRGQLNVISHWHELFRNIQRFVSNAYMDSEKQNAPNVFLGHLQPQEGRPPVGRSGSANIRRRSFKESSSGHIRPGKAGKSYEANSQLFPAGMQDDSREHSDSDSEISVSHAKLSFSSGNSNTMKGIYLSVEGKTDLNDPGSGYQLCSSNFMDPHKLLSSLNSCEKFARSSPMNSHAAASSDSAESYRGGQNDEGTEKTPLLHKKHPISKFRDFSDCFVQWVSNWCGMLCHL